MSSSTPLPPSDFDPSRTCKNAFWHRQDMFNPARFPGTGFGRMAIEGHMYSHNTMIERASTCTNSHISPASLRQLRFRQEVQCWKETKNEATKRELDDQMMANIIKRAYSVVDNRIDAHVLRYKAHRVKHPTHIPGWLEQMTIDEVTQKHRDIIKGKGVQRRIDTDTPRAMQYRRFLQSGSHTVGGARRPLDLAKLRPRSNINPPEEAPKRPPTRDHLPSRRRVRRDEFSGGDFVMTCPQTMFSEVRISTPSMRVTTPGMGLDALPPIQATAEVVDDPEHGEPSGD